MEKLVLDIIAKVRNMYKYDKEYNKILSGTPSINVHLEDNKLVLHSLSFGTYDCIYAYKDIIKFVNDDRTEQRTLCEYNSFEDLLNL